MKKHLVIGLCLAMLGSNLVQPDEGRIPLFEQTVITESGKYVVTRNIEPPFPPPGGPLITVNANADIDLNGFTLFNADGPVISSTGGTLRVHNGTIGMGGIQSTQGYIVLEDLFLQSQVLLDAPSQFVFRRLFGGYITAHDNDPNIPQSGIIEDSSIGSISFHGIINFVIRHNTLGGLFIQSIISGSRGAVTDNTVAGGITFGCSQGKLSGNTVIASGIVVMGDGNLILDNVMNGNSGAGLTIRGARNHVEGNLMSGNSSFGLLFDTGSTGNVYRGNTARGNSGITSTCPAGCSPDLCDRGTGNTSNGDNFLPGPPTFPACK